MRARDSHGGNGEEEYITEKQAKVKKTLTQTCRLKWRRISGKVFKKGMWKDRSVCHLMQLSKSFMTLTLTEGNRAIEKFQQVFIFDHVVDSRHGLEQPAFMLHSMDRSCLSKSVNA